MDRTQKLNYYKKIVKRHLLSIKKDLKASKNVMELNYYIDRYDVQLRDYARALNVNEKHLDTIIKNSKQ